MDELLRPKAGVKWEGIMLNLSICHYSFHRCWKEENWTVERLCQEVKALGVEAVDFHAGLLGEREGAAEKIKTALSKTGLALSGFSLSTNFNLDDPDVYEDMLNNTIAWMRVASEVGAPVSRIFGGTLRDRLEIDETTKNNAFQRVTDALGRLANEAEKLGLVLALENHGGLPCSGAEQVDMIRSVGSKYLRATIDVANYLACGQEAVEGTRIAADYGAYVHLKDYKKYPDSSLPWGWGIKRCTIGKGDVDQLGCLRELKAAGYDGYLAIEYEGPDDERVGVPESVEFMRSVMNKL